jgi:hypothetical protein
VTRPPLVIEKRKWDGTVSTRWIAQAVAAPGDAVAWFTPAGTARERPRKGGADVTVTDQLGVAPGGWWIVTAHADDAGGIDHHLVDAALPPERPSAGRLTFVDLDLDLRLAPGDEDGELEDVEQFHERARTMGYPPQICHGAWEGLAAVRLAYRRGAWPFDGWMAEMLRVASTVGGSR